ncbi:MAG: DNRLRE domain-containing protein [Melioribacteraceae bacterium]
MNKFLLKHKQIFIYLILTLFLVACNNDPTSVGSELLQDVNKIKLNEFNTQKENVKLSSNTFKKKITLGVSDKLILGKNSYIESYILLSFNIYLADSIVTKIKDNKLRVAETWMDMKVKYSLGDKNLPFDFTVHQVRKNWGSDAFNYDSLKILNYDANDVSYSRSITDTLVKFNLAPNTVFEWLKYSVDTTLAPPNYGLLFKPTSATQRLLGFKGYQLNNDPDVPTLYIVLEQPSVFKDTILVSPYMDIHVVNGADVYSLNDIVLEGGLGYKGFLFFDLSSLPKNIIISKATLELNVDSLKSFDGSPSSDSIIVKVLKDSISKSYTSDSSYYAILSRNGNTFSGDISWMVQKWVSGQEDNQGLELSLADEKSSAARIWIYGSKQSEALRPRLKIYYLNK